MSRRSWTLVTLIGLAFSARAMSNEVSPTWTQFEAGEVPTTFTVTQYLDQQAGESDLVVVNGGKSSGIVPGAGLKVFRLASPGQINGSTHPVWIETGRLKVIEVQEDIAIAQVEAQSSLLAKAVFPKFPTIMAHDVAVLPRVNIARRQLVLPAVTLAYSEMFEDPKGTPGTFEMTAEGMARLKAATQVFAGARVSLLMIEGYTDHHGPSSANQVESYQRALTVRQYLVTELGFDEKRVVAVGLGDSEPVGDPFVPGAADMNRRIVIKAVPLPSAEISAAQ